MKQRRPRPCPKLLSLRNAGLASCRAADVVTQVGIAMMSSRGLLKIAVVGLVLATWLGCKASPYREVEIDSAAANGERLFPAADPQRLRFSIAAMMAPRNTYAAYSRLFSRVSELLGIPIEIVQRRTYREVNDLLLDGHLDAGLLCTGGYLDLRSRVCATPAGVEVLAVPVINGKTTYQSLIIVPATSPAAAFLDLRGKRFAFTDELSLSGHAYAVHLLRNAHEDPARFFGDSILTHSHDQSIEAVASGLVDGAVVDSLVYESMIAENPERATKTRIIDRSAPLGMTPVVAAPSLSPAMRARLREILLELDRDPSAAAALRVTHIERFVVPPPGLYDSAAALLENGR